jgi:hypothetical protein
MRKSLFIWLLLPVVFLASCNLIYDQPDAIGCPELSIAIEFPENFVPQTRATVGEVPAEEDENAIHNLAIWVFYSEGDHAHEYVGSIFVEDAKDLPSAGGVRKYALLVKKAFMLERPKVDVFVLANLASIGSSLKTGSDGSNYDQVHDAIFGGGNAYFSPQVPVTAVSSAGLPMSGVGKGLTVGGEEPFLKVPTISLSRAVSKVRFIFSQMYTEKSTEESEETAEAEEYAIEKVVLNGYQIPMYEYVFSSGSTRIQPNNYVSSDLEILWPTTLDLKSSEAPEIYSYAGQDGPSYEQLIKDGINTNHLSHLGTYYLRESDKRLAGTVHYSIKKGDATEHKELPFYMDKAGDFARNHTWTVYGYFISNRTLQLGVSALPWDKNDYTIEFSTASLQVTQKFIVEENSATIVPTDIKDHYNVFLDANRAAKGHLYVTTPQGGKLVIIKDGAIGDTDAFTVEPGEALINPSKNGGRIDITIDRNRDYSGNPTGKTITLTFKAFTPDGEREIDGATECVDQVYHFYL